MELSTGGGVKSSRSKDLQDLQASLPLEMLRSWNFLNHGEERIKPILCHPEFISGSSHSKTLGSTQKEKVVASSMGQMLKRVQHDIMWGRKAAFTLAEVLITLGIIGVVAAMTLPTLIQNYQKRVYVTQLKKSVSVLSNGFKLMMAHDGVTELQDTHAFSGMGADVCGSLNNFANNILTNNCSSIREGLQSVFSGIQLAPCDETAMKYLNGAIIPSNADAFRKSTLTCAKFPDGSEIYGYTFNKSSDGFMGDFKLDINGPKNPNTMGRDIFLLYVSDNGTIVPRGSQQANDYTIAKNPGYYANNNITSMYWRTTQKADKKCTTDDSSARGHMCAARVLEEDAMNY